MQTTTFSTRPSGSPAGAAAFEFLRRTPRPLMPDRHEHFASRAAYWERVVSGLSAAHAVAVLTATYDLVLWELDGVQDTAFARNKAFFAGVDAASQWEPVAEMAAHIAAVEAGVLPAKSPPVARGGGFLPATHAAPWSEWRSPAESAMVRLYTVVPVMILQDHNGRTIVETA